jgi:hypothetical protein
MVYLDRLVSNKEYVLCPSSADTRLYKGQLPSEDFSRLFLYHMDHEILFAMSLAGYPVSMLPPPTRLVIQSQRVSPFLLLYGTMS